MCNHAQSERLSPSVGLGIKDASMVAVPIALFAMALSSSDTLFVGDSRCGAMGILTLHRGAPPLYTLHQSTAPLHPPPEHRPSAPSTRAPPLYTLHWSTAPASCRTRAICALLVRDWTLTRSLSHTDVGVHGLCNTRF